ncbi:hypothetical protein MMC21_001745 [Puttea exsequens]|nr:hypothetical protein [Puttea exsequens]
MSGSISTQFKALIFPCRTSHTRFFPKKHSFSYSYLLVGVPIGWRGRLNSLLTVDVNTPPAKSSNSEHTWYSVDSADYLQRGVLINGLQGKLDAYLKSQNERPQDYAHAYLITAPKFLGYSFNPVSFWYLYDDQMNLRAMILEVNNTFDERRVYFLKDTELRNDELKADDYPHSHEAAANNLYTELQNNKFAATWPKDFHVSPFNSRKGSYALSAIDPFTRNSGNGRVNNIITLSSSKDHPKLVARIFSTADSIDPSTLTTWQSTRFIARWWWVGFVTFPRIVREAAKLFFRRKLHVWYRPEVLKDSIGRKETPAEVAVATIFRNFLKALVETSDHKILVHFSPGIASMAPTETFTSLSSEKDADAPEDQSPLTLKSTTPLFYAQIACSASILTFFRSAIANPDLKSSTFYTSNSKMMVQLLEHPSNQCYNSHSSTLPKCPLLPRLRWSLLQLLRPNQNLTNLDVVALHMRKSNLSAAEEYRKAAVKLLLGDRIFFGVPEIAGAVGWAVRIWLCWICVLSLERLLVIGVGGWQTNWAEFVGLILGCLDVVLWRSLVWVVWG